MKNLTQIIELPHGVQKATFKVEELISHFRNENIDYIIIGANHVKLSNHPKPKSLDFWLRNHKNIDGHEDTCKAVASEITKLIKYEQFSKGIGKCPTSNRMYEALIFCEK